MRIVDGKWRLAVARALTSPRWLKAGVSDKPDAYTWLLPDEAQIKNDGRAIGGGAGYVLVVASDGVWGTMSSGDVARSIALSWARGDSAAAAAASICDRALRLGSSDNVSAACVYIARKFALSS